MENKRPKKLSVITINLNNKPGLEKTIKSVSDQTFTDFEYLIIDGASSDGSVDVIKNNNNKIDFWISESDTGIYNAMNKGIRNSTGIYCLFLNSGDILANPGILEKCFNEDFSDDIIYCNLICDNGNELTYKKLSSELTFWDFFIDSIGHQSSFIKRELFSRIGFYNENFMIVSDWEFFLKAIFVNRCSLRYLDEYLAVFNTSGISGNSNEVNGNERSIVLEQLFPRFIPDYNSLLALKGYSHIHSYNKFFLNLTKVINHILSLLRKWRANRERDI
jgi:glycosyltransferase involved in cell wall biosynthesis